MIEEDHGDESEAGDACFHDEGCGEEAEEAIEGFAGEAGEEPAIAQAHQEEEGEEEEADDEEDLADGIATAHVDERMPRS